LNRLALDDAVAGADRPVATARPAARLEDAAVIAGLAQLVGGGHAGDAGAENGDRRAAAGAADSAGGPA